MSRLYDTSVRAFASHVQNTGSSATARKYEEAASKFLKIMKFNGITTFENLPRNVLQLYVDSQIGVYQPSSIHVYIAGVKRYLGWVRNQGIKVPELADPEAPKIAHRIRDVLSSDNMQIYFDQAAELLQEPSRTAVLLLPCTGLRASEMVELPLSAIHKVVVPLKDGRIKKTYALRVIGKGNKERSVPVLDQGVEFLLEYLAGWRRKRSGPWIFPGMVSKANKQGQHPMSVRTLRDAVAEIREPLGMKITPHTLRRTYLTSLHRMDVDVVTLAQIGGHANIQTLYKHYIVPDEQDVLSAVHSKGSVWS